VHFPLHPETPEDGARLEDLFAGRGIDLEAMYTYMKTLMDAEGLPYTRRTHTHNSWLAQELGKWADTQPGGEAIHDLLYRAYFVDGINIGDIDELVSIAASIGLSADAAREVLESRSFSASVDVDWRSSRDLGITGVPTFVAGGFGIVGAQEYNTLESLLQRAGAQAKSAPDSSS
jgi:predicted DsbA family dithiol-disulfide isomerase